MNKLLSKRITVLLAITAILSIPNVQGTQTFAEEKKESDSVNDIFLVVNFHFREKIETVETFKVFDTQSSGFDRTKATTFRLEGVIGGDRPMLYKAIDQTYQLGKNQNHDYSEFDVDVIFHNEPSVYRKFIYSDCQVKNYNVFTEFDKEETYQGKTKFAYIDKVEFECRGFGLGNPTYEKMMQDEIKQKTSDALKSMKVKNKNSQ
jgi:hypothetical protein